MPTHKFSFDMPYWADTPPPQKKKKEIIKKKHIVRAGQDFPPLAVLVLEYQRNTGNQNLVLEYQI